MMAILSTISAADPLIEPIVLTTLDTATAPFDTTSEDDNTSWIAWRILSTFCLTALVNTFTEVVISSTELACCSVRDQKSRFPETI